MLYLILGILRLRNLGYDINFGLDDKFMVRLICVLCAFFQAMETEIDDLKCENESNLATVNQLRQVSISFVFPYY